jgi:hypothetical protein
MAVGAVAGQVADKPQGPSVQPGRDGVAAVAVPPGPPPTAPRDLTVGLTFPDLLVAALNGVVPRKNS